MNRAGLSKKIAFLLHDVPERDVIANVFSAVFVRMLESGAPSDAPAWVSRSVATSTLAWMLLPASFAVRPLSRLCVGGIRVHHSSFYTDHAWVEIDGRPYDVSIVHLGLQNQDRGGWLPDFHSRGVFGGIELYSGKSTRVRYGAYGGSHIGTALQGVARQTLGEHWDGSVGKMGERYPHGMWDVFREIAARFDLTIDMQDARERAKLTSWFVREPQPAALEEESCPVCGAIDQTTCAFMAARRPQDLDIDERTVAAAGRPEDLDASVANRLARSPTPSAEEDR